MPATPVTAPASTRTCSSVAERPAGRGSFAPVVLAGVVSGIALTMGGAETWFSLTESPDSGAMDGLAYSSSLDIGVVSPANALALVGLACWGVLLVTRGRVRRAVAVLGLLVATAQLATVGYSYLTLPDDVREQFEALTPTGTPPELGFTGWFWVATAAALVSAAAWTLAVLRGRAWPEMGRRYDTPSDSPPEDLWKAMDQGQDPTS